jgi:UDP-N-acetylmuramyl tripeptide synthase
MRSTNLEIATEGNEIQGRQFIPDLTAAGHIAITSCKEIDAAN